MKKISSVFSSLQDKLHRDKGEKKVLSPCTDALPPPDCNPSLGRPPFFEYLVVVSVRKRTGGDEGYEPQIIYQFPKSCLQSQRRDEETCLKAITLFCFPEGVTWAPLTEYRSETFSFVLTEIDGSRRNGYCRRLLPLGKGARPPEAYCIISTLACFSLFSKIFDEVEKRRQISMAMIYPFMQSLRETAFPAPGKTVTIKSFIPESGTELKDYEIGKRGPAEEEPFPQLDIAPDLDGYGGPLLECRGEGEMNFGTVLGKLLYRACVKMITLTRPVDSWLEHVEFHSLFQCLSDEEVLQVFAATVLERRIVFIAEELSTLSQVLHAVAALLFPFIWQHTFISIVPKVLLDVYLAPTPYLLGIQKNLLHLLTEHTDLLIVDLTSQSECKFISRVGDEDMLIPSRLQEELLQDLCKRKHNASTEELNSVVSEAFLSFFVKTVGHFANHIKRSGGNKQLRTFQKKNFLKAVEPKENLNFVKQFVQTQMFDLFIQEEEKLPHHEGFFHRKIVEFQLRKKEKSKTGVIKGLVV